MTAKKANNDGQHKFTISMPESKFRFARERAVTDFRGNESAYFRSLVDLDKLDLDKISDQLLALYSGIERAATQVGVSSIPGKSDVNRPGVTFVFPQIKVGILPRVRFREETGERYSIQATTSAIASGACTEVWIVVPDDITTDDFARFKGLASNIAAGHVMALKLGQLIEQIKRRLDRAQYP